MLSAKKTKYHLRNFKPQSLEKNNIDRLSTSLVPEKSRLLELGCATGFMSQYFTQTKHCQVIGVDINLQAIKQARQHCYKTICGDLDDKSTWKKIKSFAPYDIVFASAVIEHLKHSETTLQLIKQILKPKGILIITTPNVAHWRNRLSLLLGHWQYQDYGTLDKDHLRFFTYYSFQALIKQAGFTLKSVTLDPAGGFKYFNWLFKHCPNLYAYQICIQAQKT